MAAKRRKRKSPRKRRGTKKAPTIAALKKKLARIKKILR